MDRLFVVYGVPVGKGRPRFRSTGKFVQTYTPEKTANYETLVKLAYQQQFAGAPMLQGALAAVIVAFFPIPKSTSKLKRAMMLNRAIVHTNKPDADNIIKIICDALNGVAYQDDSAIYSVHLVKYYAEEPRVEIGLREYLCIADGQHPELLWNKKG